MSNFLTRSNQCEVWVRYLHIDRWPWLGIFLQLWGKIYI